MSGGVTSSNSKFEEESDISQEDCDSDSNSRNVQYTTEYVTKVLIETRLLVKTFWKVPL